MNLIYGIINGATALRAGLASLEYRATALLAGIEAGCFLTLKDAARGGFEVCNPEAGPDFVAFWQGTGVGVEHPQYRASRFVGVFSIPRETARVRRYAAADPVGTMLVARQRVAALAKERHAKAARLMREHPVAAHLLAATPDREAVEYVAGLLRFRLNDSLAEWKEARQALRAEGFETL